MTYHTMRRRLFGFASSLSLLGALLATVPYSLESQAATMPADRTALGDTSQKTATLARSRSQSMATFWGALDLQPKDAWERLRASFEWRDQWRADAGHDRSSTGSTNIARARKISPRSPSEPVPG